MLSFLLASLPLLYPLFFSRTLVRSSAFVIIHAALTGILSLFFHSPLIPPVMAAVIMLLTALAAPARRAIIHLTPALPLIMSASFIPHGTVITLFSAIAGLAALFARKAGRPVLVLMCALGFSLDLSVMYRLPAVITVLSTLIFSVLALLLSPVSNRRPS